VNPAKVRFFPRGATKSVNLRRFGGAPIELKQCQRGGIGR